MRLILAANHGISPIRYVLEIDKQLEKLTPTDALLLRAPRIERIAEFERVCAVMAKTRDIPVRWFQPEVGGREQNYLRDIRMIHEADLLVAYFHPERVMEGGTGHLVEAAISQGLPCFAWSCESAYEVAWVGAWDKADPLEAYRGA